MANHNPVQGRLALRRRRRAGDLRDLMRATWRGVNDAEATLDMAVTVAERCSAIHALSAIAITYTKILQVGEYEARLAQLEAMVAKHESAHQTLDQYRISRN
jgi:hypothetical protein